MSFNKIESAIITAKQITHWDFHLIEYNHTKNPNEYYVTTFLLHPLNY